MKAVRVPFLLVLAFLAVLPAGLSSPVVADWGNISVIALRGQTVIPPVPAPTITLADFGPPDINMNTWANIVDVLKFKPYIMTSVSPSPQRFDFDADGDIDIVDVLKYKPVILKSCTNP